MKKIRIKERVESYMSKEYRIIITPDPEGGYVAEIPELPGCITQGDTKEEVLAMIEDAKRAWIETALKRGKAIPEPLVEKEYSGRFVVRIPKSLHKRLSELAEKEGVSLNTLVVQFLAEGLGKKEVSLTIQSKIISRIERLERSVEWILPESTLSAWMRRRSRKGILSA